MDAFIEIIAGNSTMAGITAAAIFVAIVLGAWLARLVVTRILAALAARTQTRVDDLLLLMVRKVSLFCVAVVAFYLAQKALVLPDKLAQLFRAAAMAAAFLQVALWGNSAINFLLVPAGEGPDKQDVNVTARRAMVLFSRIVLWTLVAALLLENLGIRLSPLLAGIGIGGIAIALALQNILGDVFCYVAIILDKPFVAGDFIIVGDLMGTVERIGIKATRVRALSGEQLIFANQDLVSSRIRNYKTLQERRVVFRFGVVYETPPEKLRRIPDLVRAIFESLEQVRLDRVHFAQLADFSLNFEVVYYVQSGDYVLYMDRQQAVNLALIQACADENITFAYPTQQLYVKNQ